MNFFLEYCNGQKCVEHAECKNSTCVCETGFHGDGFFKCERKFYCKNNFV